jgi:peptide-methionine (S)-S-oxide reductase
MARIGDMMTKSIFAGGAAIACAIVLSSVSGLPLIGSAAAESVELTPMPALDVKPSGTRATAVLAGGCFWGMEAVFSHLKGVTSVVSGYAGGASADANYDRVSSETTRHAEAIRITYDPRTISYATLLRVYFSVAHDPTQLNRQGPDSGTSYRQSSRNRPTSSASPAPILRRRQKAASWASPSSRKSKPADSMRPKPITRILRSKIPITAISACGTFRKSHR